MLISVNSELRVTEYSDQVNTYIKLLHESYAIQTKKLNHAFAHGIITEVEYDQWLEFFKTSRKEWLAKDLTQPGNIIFLKVMARHNMEIARKLKFERK